MAFPSFWPPDQGAAKAGSGDYGCRRDGEAGMSTGTRAGASGGTPSLREVVARRVGDRP